MRLGKRRQCFAQTIAAFDDIGQSVAVEGGQKVVAGLGDHAGELADLRDEASIAFVVEALDRLKRPLGVADNLAQVDLARRAVQLDATALAPVGLDESAAS